MRLDLLLKREVFEDSFIKTITKYLKHEYSWNSNIVWTKFSLSTDISGKFIVNEKLNVIYHSKISRDKLYDLTSEFAYHPNFVRNILQKLYVKFATTKLFERFTSSYICTINNYPKEFEEICVIPGNHSIRLIDFKNNTSTVVLKDGFNKDCLLREVDIRQNYQYLPIPNLILNNTENDYYIEDRIVALPWNRISDIQIKNKSILDARSQMLKLYKETYQQVTYYSYIEKLEQLLNLFIKKLPLVYDQDYKTRIMTIYNQLLSTIPNLNIHTVVSHGDFQPANIMVDLNDKSKVYIIDWEYSKQRFYLYDILVFECSIRMTKGLSNRLKEVNINNIKWLFDELGLEYNNLEPWMISLCLIEDLLVRLEELQIPTLRYKSESLEQFLFEIEQMDWLVNE